MNDPWTIKIDLSARDFNTLKSIAGHLLEQIKGARCYKDLPDGSASAYSGLGEGQFEYSYNVERTCPIEARIELLRAEAAELESQLKSGVRE